jgi:hypothetical protein
VPAAPCALGFGLFFGPVPGLGAVAEGTSLSVQDPGAPRLLRAGGAAGGSVAVRARGEGPRRHPESPADPGLPPAAPPAAHLSSPIAWLQPPPHGEYPRPIACRPRALQLQLFFRLVLIWTLVAVVFLLYLTTLPPRSLRCPPPVSLSLPRLAPQAPGAGEGSSSCPGRCSLSLPTALRPCFSALAPEMLFLS